MAQTTSVANSAEERELVITRVFDAPRNLVFKAWTQPEHLARWWGPQGFVNVAWEMDVRPGGVWFRRMRAPDGTLFTKRGVYPYVNEAADGTLDRETLVTLTFDEQGARTRLTLQHTGFDSVESRDAHQGGWTSCLERFAEYLAAA